MNTETTPTATTFRSDWPLPATYLPNFRLSWAEWTRKLHDWYSSQSQQRQALADAA